MRLAAVFLIALTGGASAQTIIDQSADRLPDVEVKEFVRQVTSDLVDPMSTQIREISRSSDPTKQDIICGWMNTKNQMGGYTGFRLVAFGPISKQRRIYWEELSKFGDFTEAVISHETGCPNEDPITK